MSSTRPSLGRLLKIHASIAGSKYPSLAQLADLCDVHPRTIERDLVALRCDYGAPLAYSKRHEGYYYREPFHLGELPFSDDEVTAMMLGLSLVVSMPNIPFVPALQRSLDVLHAWLPPPFAGGWSTNGPYVSYQVEAPGSSNVEMNIIFRELLHAIIHRRTVRLTLAIVGDERHCLVDPYHLYHSAGAWNLHGRWQRTGEATDLALTHIVSVQILTETFALPDKAEILSNLGKSKAIVNDRLTISH
jgi:predicted DNA-binding transcriptional regulator YafY